MWGKWFQRWKNRLLSAALVVLLAGCQPLDGVDLNAMLMNQLDIRSAEQAGSFELIIDWNEQYIENNEDESFAKLAQLLSHVKVDIDRVLAEENRAYAEGSVSLGGKPPIGFVMRVDEYSLYLELEGFKRPIYIDAREIAGEDAVDAALGYNRVTNEIAREMAKDMGAYFIRHLPNPPVLTIARESATVGGQSQALTKVHAEIKGDAIGDWLIAYLDALLQDEEGLREMVRAVTEKMIEMYELDPAVLEDAGIPDEDADETLEELEYFAEEGFDELLWLLQAARNDLEDMRQDAQWNMIFDEGIELKMNVWVDDQLYIRKSDMELVIAPAVLRLPIAPVHSVTIRSKDEYWNINGPIEIPLPEAASSAWGVRNFANTSQYGLLRMLEEDSVLYDLLKNEFRIDDSRFLVSPYNFYGTAPFVAEDGTLYVPLRDTLEQFGIGIAFDQNQREIRFFDEGTQQEIVLYLDSAAALVNGQTVELSRPLVVIDAFTYIAADDLFQLLRAAYTFEKDEWDDVWVNVERDL